MEKTRTNATQKTSKDAVRFAGGMSECPERTFSSVFVALRYKDPRTKQAITLYPGEEKTLAKSPSKVFVAINAALGGNIYPPETDLMLKSCNVAMNGAVNATTHHSWVKKNDR